MLFHSDHERQGVLGHILDGLKGHVTRDQVRAILGAESDSVGEREQRVAAGNFAPAVGALLKLLIAFAAKHPDWIFKILAFFV